MSYGDMAQPLPIDILGVDFGDRAVTIQYTDPRLDTEFGSEVRQIMLRPEKFGDRISELLDDLFDLIQAYHEAGGGVPAYRPARGAS